MVLVQPKIVDGMPWTSTPEPPLGLASIAACSRDEHDYSIYDNFLYQKSNETAVREIMRGSPDAVGLSITSFTLANAEAMARSIKRASPQTLVFVGGPHASLFPREVLACDSFDAAVIGEGEITAPEYLKSAVSRDESELAKVNGLAFKNKKDQIFVNEPRPYIKDLDALPFPARDLLPVREYPEYKFSTALRAPVLTSCTSRGCPYNCLYCSSPSIWGRTWRALSAKRMADEAEMLQRDYGMRSIKYHEDHFTFNRQRVFDFCAEVRKRKLDFAWQCESRVNMIDEKLLSEMRDAGCEIIWFGIESGTQKILDFYRKGTNIALIKNAVAAAHKAGLKPMGSFIIGAPPETVEEMEQTIEFGLSLGLEDVYFNILVAFPGSDLYDYVKKNNFVHATLPGGLIEVEGAVPREAVEKMRLRAQQRVLWGKLKRKWPRLLRYYATHPWMLASERARRVAKFMLRGK